jgi:ABC-type cobalamin transport system ATPase subunit
MTEINFGLHSAGRGRFARHGGQEQWLMYLRTAIILDLHQPDGTRRIADLQQFSQRLNLTDKVERSWE